MEKNIVENTSGSRRNFLTKKNAFFGFMMMFITPVLIWMYIFKSFLNGSITLMQDTDAVYSMFKFFYNNLFNGAVALWDPYVSLGVPYVYTATSGVLSPLMGLFASLHFLGLNYYASFILFILFFFILGLTGFYLLAFEILEDRFCAWVSFIAFLFSGMGPMLFNQIFIYFLFCPAVWLFYFLLRFSKGFEPKYFLGVIVVLMNMLCFYIPFYFLTLFLFFTVFLICFFPRSLIDFFKGLKGFIAQKRQVFFGGILVIVFALMPLIYSGMTQGHGNLLFLNRRDPNEKIEYSENALNKYSAAAMTFNEVSIHGTLGERISGGRLFSHLDKFYYGSNDFFYIPVLIYIVIFISTFVLFGRKQLFILCLGLSVFLLSLGQVSFLHKILFDMIFYFKYFRNFYFFMAYLIPIVILFAAFQLKALLASSQLQDKRWQKLTINTLLHFCFLCILYWHGNILISTYVTVLISCVLFNILFLKPGALKFVFLLIVVIEPMQVFAAYEINSLHFKYFVPNKHFVSTFSYERPSVTNEKARCVFPQADSYASFWYDQAMQDPNGYIPLRPLVVSKYTYLLSKTMDDNDFLNYVRHKFYIYDRPETLASPLIISQDTDQFKVVGFNPDRVQLMSDFNTDKFLVYTDSFDKYWKVFINGHEQKLYRAHMAFKGVWLTPGRNKIDFQYSVTGEKELYLLLLLGNLLLMGYFIRRLCLK